MHLPEHLNIEDTSKPPINTLVCVSKYKSIFLSKSKPVTFRSINNNSIISTAENLCGTTNTAKEVKSQESMENCKRCPAKAELSKTLTLASCLGQGFYSCTDIRTKKQVGEERVSSAYTSILLFITERSQDWNSSRSERADAEAMEGCSLLACFSWLPQPALLQNPRLPAQRWSHPQGAFPP